MPVQTRIPEASAHPKIIITGSSGYIGQHLLKQLSSKKVSCLSSYRNRIPESLEHIYPVHLDLSLRETVSPALKNIHTVIHLAWEKSFFECEKENVSEKNKNLLSMKNLIEVAQDSKVKRLVFLSAVGASKQTDSEFLKEKYQAEHALLNSTISEKIIIRSSVVFGGENNNGKFIKSMKRLMRFPGVYPLPKERGRVSPVHIDDLCTVLENLLSFKSPSSTILDVVGKEAYRLEDLFRIVTENMNENRIALGTRLGDWLISFLERERNLEDQSIPKLKSFLDLGNLIEEKIRNKNPILGVLPLQLKGFKEV